MDYKESHVCLSLWLGEENMILNMSMELEVLAGMEENLFLPRLVTDGDWMFHELAEVNRKLVTSSFSVLLASSNWLSKIVEG